jgi:hypothetical protein
MPSLSNVAGRLSAGLDLLMGVGQALRLVRVVVRTVLVLLLMATVMMMMMMMKGCFDLNGLGDTKMENLDF